MKPNGCHHGVHIVDFRLTQWHNDFCAGGGEDNSLNAKTPADHMKLSKHYTALAAQYERQAAEHAAIADVERKAPNAGTAIVTTTLLSVVMTTGN